MRHHAEHRLFEHVLGLRQRLLPVRAVSCGDADLGKGHSITALGLGLEEGDVVMGHANLPFLAQILRAQPQLPQDRAESPRRDLAASGWHHRHPANAPNHHMAALAACRIDGRIEAAQFPEQLSAGHRDGYTFLCIKRHPPYQGPSSA